MVLSERKLGMVALLWRAVFCQTHLLHQPINNSSMIGGCEVEDRAWHYNVYCGSMASMYSETGCFHLFAQFSQWEGLRCWRLETPCQHRL